MVVLWPLVSRRAPCQPLCWRRRQVTARLRPFFALSLWDHTATVVAGTTGESAGVSSVRSVGVDSGRHSWRAKQLRALLWPLIARSSWVLLATVVASTTGECAALASVRLVGVGTANYCCGGHER